MADKLSTFVITYNRASLLETCLRAASFADELIVIDKSSTDDSAAVAARHADRVERVPWSPTVEETRAFAASLCRHEWILCLDDDEILSPETGPYLQRSLADCKADILAIPLRHYILGVHDERAYYWPEEHYRLFRRGAVEFIPLVHGGVALQSDRRASIPVDSGVCIHHLSYLDVADWIARSNRYTSRPTRVQADTGTGQLIQFAHEQIDYWMQRSDDRSGNDYPAAVALLRAIYDMVDRLKAWETDRGMDGAALFRIAQQTLVPTTHGGQRRAAPRTGNDDASAIEGRDHRAAMATGDGDTNEPAQDDADGMAGAADDWHMATQAMRVRLMATEAQLRDRSSAARNAALDLAGVRRDLEETKAALAMSGHELDDTLVLLQQARANLHDAELRHGAVSAELAGARQELANISNSARRFIRQYLPKLRRHLMRRLLRPSNSAGKP